MESSKASQYETPIRLLATDDGYELAYSDLSEKPCLSEVSNKGSQKVNSSSPCTSRQSLVIVLSAFMVIAIAFLTALVAIAIILMNNVNGLLQKSQQNQELSHPLQPGSVMSLGMAQDCDDIRRAGFSASDTYHIKLGNAHPDIRVWCNMEADTGWLVIQRRVDGSINFTRGWLEYKAGFGKAEHEFWLGLGIIHILTQRPTKLRVRLESWTGEWRSAVYSRFSVANEDQYYTLSISGFSDGGLGDSLGWHNNMKFTTIDRDNDAKPNGNCAQICKGGWWYNNCHDSNLNGLYYQGGNTTTYGLGAVWKTWKGLYYSYKTVVMEISPS